MGDLAETIALLLPPPREAHDLGLAGWVEQRLLPLRGAAEASPEQLRPLCARNGGSCAAEERLVYFKLITGAFRVGVSKLQVTQALAAVGGHRCQARGAALMGYTRHRRAATRPTTTAR